MNAPTPWVTCAGIGLIAACVMVLAFAR